MVDLVAAYLTTRAFVNGMIDAGWGRIVNFTSAASLHPPGPLNSAYGTSKAGLNQLTRHLAAELEGTGVTANVIHPGDVKTAMWATSATTSPGSGPRPTASAVGRLGRADGRRSAGKGGRPRPADPPSELNGEFSGSRIPCSRRSRAGGEGAELQPWLE